MARVCKYDRTSAFLVLPLRNGGRTWLLHRLCPGRTCLLPGLPPAISSGVKDDVQWTEAHQGALSTVLTPPMFAHQTDLWPEFFQAFLQTWFLSTWLTIPEVGRPKMAYPMETGFNLPGGSPRQALRSQGCGRKDAR